ncbi:hypothetical protein D9M68_768210 [compost metagenome]
MAGKQKGLSFSGPAHMVLRRRRAGMAVPILGLQLRGQAHAPPLGLVQLAIAIAVEARQQAGEVTLPFADHRPLGARHVQSLAAAATGVEIANGVERFPGMQALLGVAVLAAADP